MLCFGEFLEINQLFLILFTKKITMLKLFDVFGEFFHTTNTYFLIRKFGRSVGRGFLRSLWSL
jgi:hypothetical protein